MGECIISLGMYLSTSSSNVMQRWAAPIAQKAACCRPWPLVVTVEAAATARGLALRRRVSLLRRARSPA